MTGSRLSDAWRKYVETFGEPPHGTEKQMNALLALAGYPVPSILVRGDAKRPGGKVLHVAESTAGHADSTPTRANRPRDPSRDGQHPRTSSRQTAT